MKTRFALWATVLLAFANVSAPAATLYVSLTSTNPVPPYADWSTAATNIQDAVDASSDGDLILVTSGVYATGGEVFYGALTNRVVINKAVTIQSVNGPEATIIQGYQDPAANYLGSSNSVRCLYATNGAVVIGFTLTDGGTGPGEPLKSFYDLQGGGAWCESTNVILSNCVLIANSAVSAGGGVYSGTLNNCLISSNSVRIQPVSQIPAPPTQALISTASACSNNSGRDGVPPSQTWGRRHGDTTKGHLAPPFLAQK